MRPGGGRGAASSHTAHRSPLTRSRARLGPERFAKIPSRIVTREEAAPANVHEGRKLHEVLEINARRVAADKACDSNRNHPLSANRIIHSAIALKRTRLGHPLGGKRPDRWIQDDRCQRRSARACMKRKTDGWWKNHTPKK